MNAAFIQFLLFSLVVLCSWEESLELPSLRQSQILCNFLRLMIELLASVLRIPIRIFVRLGFCRVSSLQNCNRLAKHLYVSLHLQTEEESTLLLQTIKDEDDQAKQDACMLRAQKRLARALDEVAKLRRDNLALSTRLNDLQTERTSILCAVEELAKPTRGSTPVMVCQDSPVFEAPPGRSGSPHEGHDALTSVRERFASLELEFYELQGRYHKVQQEVGRLSKGHDRLNMELARSNASHEDMKCQTQALRRLYIAALRVDSKRIQMIRKLCLALMFISSFNRHLGTRLARSLRVQQRVLTRSKIVASQKSVSHRERIKFITANQDLRRKLEIQIARCRDRQNWQSEYYKSLKTRELAARKFIAYHHYATSRYTSTVTQLLTGLLILWRLSLLLSQQLAEARCLARVLEESAIAQDKIPAYQQQSELRARLARVEERITAMAINDSSLFESSASGSFSV